MEECIEALDRQLCILSRGQWDEEAEAEGYDMFLAWLNTGMLRIALRRSDRTFCMRYPCLPLVAPSKPAYPRPERRARIEELERETVKIALGLGADSAHLIANGVRFYSITGRQPDKIERPGKIILRRPTA
jgi:hypothetical protein